MTIPIISLHMPWANWVILEWKPIETRTHRRFQGLVGRRIGIHASAKWDKEALAAARPYLTEQQYSATCRFLKIGGAVIGSAYVAEFRELTKADSKAALIDCGEVKRFGLILKDVRGCEAIPMKGHQGIWYAELPGIESQELSLFGKHG